jgi:hypothetical protein
MGRALSPPKSLTVRRQFEPNRLAPECLAAAYAWVAPLSRRPLGAAPFPHSRRSAGEERRKEAA